MPNVDEMLRKAIDDISDSDVVAAISKYIVAPRVAMRNRDYAVHGDNPPDYEVQ